MQNIITPFTWHMFNLAAEKSYFNTFYLILQLSIIWLNQYLHVVKLIFSVKQLNMWTLYLEDGD